MEAQRQREKLIPSVAFILLRGNEMLVEMRKASKSVAPLQKSIPGGHIKKGETLIQALIRECIEELNIEPTDFSQLGSLVYPSERGKYLVNYFVVNKWRGNIVNNEASELFWLPVAAENVDLWINKLMVGALDHRNFLNSRKK